MQIECCKKNNNNPLPLKILLTLSTKLIGFFDQNEVNTIMHALEESLKMKQFNHPNIMNLIGVCMDASPAFHGQWQSAVLPQKGEIKPSSGGNCR